MSSMRPKSDSISPPEAPARAVDGAAATEQNDRRYWKSLDRLLDSPAVQEELGRDPAWIPPNHEFPVGASDAPTEVDRRTMLGIMGASFAMAGLAGCRRPEEAIVPYVQAPESTIPGIPDHFATTMTLGAGATGLVVESHEGRPTKVEGNELHPTSRGGSSAWHQASILDLYDPDRATQVRMKGEGGALEASTWEAAEAAWQSVAEGAAADGGSGLALVMEEQASPSLARMRAAFESRYPNARTVVYSPVSDGARAAGVEMATGAAHSAAYHLEKATAILALDCDFLHAETDAVGNARGFSEGRRTDASREGMNRLYAVESTLSVTGSMADHRLRLRSREIPAFLAAVAGHLGVDAGTSAVLPGDAAAKAELIARDLRAAGNGALVMVGRDQPAAAHALALALNQTLGALGFTVTLHPAPELAASSAQDLVDLAEAMRGGEITTLITLGSNPAYNAPVEAAFAEAMAAVETTIHLSSQKDETAALATWHWPQSHYLEAWGDARATDGTVSVVQPLIEPLFDTRSALQVLAMLAGETGSGAELVRATWRDELGVGDGTGMDLAWRRVLHDGLQADGAGDPATATVAAEGAATQLAQTLGGGGEGDYEITFPVSASVYDGRFANNGWLQELPDPITKIVWDNAARVSPADAAKLGVEDGDLIRIQTEGRELEAPVFVLAGQADGSIALPLGYGRRAVGRVGDGVGVDAYALRTAAGSAMATVSASGGHHTLVQTQEHASMEGRNLVREATMAEYAVQPDFATKPDEHHPPLRSLWEEKAYDTGYQWGMVIDLNQCTGCNACVTACQSENNIPIVGKEQVRRGREMHWLRADRYFVGDENDPEVVHQPIPCMHCENAPCEQVCPVAATVHDSEGINAMIYNRCIGTRYCSNNCPYKVRRFNFFNFTKDTPELTKMAMNPDVTVRSRGVMEKCSYCIQRISEAKAVAKRDGRRQIRDGEVRSACQQSCPSQAITFGNINDPQSAVSELKADERNYVLLGELNNKPRTSYLAKLRNPNPDWPRQQSEPPAEHA